MTMEHKSFDIEFKSDGTGAHFSGFAAVFGNEDFGGDIIEQGAFSDSLKSITAKGRKVPILWQHAYDEPVGYWEKLHETEDGLYGEGVLLTDTDALAKRAAGLIKAGAVSGLSIGYRVIKDEHDRDRDIRVLKALDLHEVSIVTFPMNDDARIDAVKASHLTAREMERILTQDAKLSRSVARSLMSDGFKSIQSMQDAGQDVEDLARLLKGRVEIATAK